MDHTVAVGAENGKIVTRVQPNLLAAELCKRNKVVCLDETFPEGPIDFFEVEIIDLTLTAFNEISVRIANQRFDGCWPRGANKLG